MRESLTIEGFGTRPIIESGFYEFAYVPTGERHVRWCVDMGECVMITHVKGQPWVRPSLGLWVWRGPIKAPEAT